MGTTRKPLSLSFSSQKSQINFHSHKEVKFMNGVVFTPYAWAFFFHITWTHIFEWGYGYSLVGGWDKKKMWKTISAHCCQCRHYRWRAFIESSSLSTCSIYFDRGMSMVYLNSDGFSNEGHPAIWSSSKEDNLNASSTRHIAQNMLPKHIRWQWQKEHFGMEGIVCENRVDARGMNWIHTIPSQNSMAAPKSVAFVSISVTLVRVSSSSHFPPAL